MVGVCKQRRAVTVGLGLFVVGLCAILLWRPVLIAEFPRNQVLDGYVVAGLLGIGLAAAACGEQTDALVFGLYALGFGVLVAPLISSELATLGAAVCFLLTGLLSEHRRTTQ